MIKVDGSYGEGGGQILRYAALYALLTGENVVIYNIRVKRPNPGLRPQHLTLLKILRDAFGGEVSGLYVGSKKVEMNFLRIKSLKGKYDVGTAGSISLILQSLVPPLLLSENESEFTLVGGTDVKWSPPIDYMRSVYSTLVKKFGGEINIEVERRGFYPRGGGIVKIKIVPSRLVGWIMRERSSNLDKVVVFNNVYRLPMHILERQRNAILDCLDKKGFRNVKVMDEHGVNSLDPGTSIVAVGYYHNLSLASGGDSLGERGKPAEVVSRECCRRFLEWFESRATLDKHIGDMVIPLAIVSDGRVEFSIPVLTSHIDSALYVSKLFYSKRFEIKREKNYTLLSFR